MDRVASPLVPRCLDVSVFSFTSSSRVREEISRRKGRCNYAGVTEVQYKEFLLFHNVKNLSLTSFFRMHIASASNKQKN